MPGQRRTTGQAVAGTLVLPRGLIVAATRKGGIEVTENSSHPGDLGRRPRHRRDQLGLTRAEVADRAGIEPALVTYIEDEPASVSAEIVLRLAHALDLPDTSLLASFENHMDDAQREGWSVLLRGRVVPSETGDEPASAEPWAGGVPVCQLRLTPRTVTGRRIFVD